jgi:AcrR family transcriptional regulator
MRKQPRQARSRATAASMLDAAAHILAERGFAGFTTNAVAERAGASIGSLYQYFPNKYALIEAVRRRHFDEVLAALRAAQDSKLPRARRIAAFADGMIAVHERFPALHRVLLEQAPHDQGADEAHRRFERAYGKACQAFFEANARRTAGGGAVPATVLAAAVAGVVHDAASRGLLAAPGLRQELVVLIDAYLRRH